MHYSMRTNCALAKLLPFEVGRKILVGVDNKQNARRHPCQSMICPQEVLILYKKFIIEYTNIEQNEQPNPQNSYKVWTVKNIVMYRDSFTRTEVLLSGRSHSCLFRRF
jgi:hypothetical protein